MYYGAVQTLAQRVMRYIRRHKLLNPGERVGVAVSGGADSVALLRLLLELQTELGVVLSVVHFNHKLRGLEADADEQFVADLASRNKLEFRCESGDVTACAAAKRLSVETAAREMRYGFFNQLLAEGRVNRVVTAHTLDDQAETVLLRVVRGAGTRGLAGIYPQLSVSSSQFSVDRQSSVAGRQVCGSIIRPLLRVRRKELEAYLFAEGQRWREDSSNRDLRHARNRVRHGILPRLERNLNPAVREILAETAEIARAEEEYWNAEVGRILEAAGRRLRDTGATVGLRSFAGLPLALQLGINSRETARTRPSCNLEQHGFGLIIESMRGGNAIHSALDQQSTEESIPHLARGGLYAETLLCRVCRDIAGLRAKFQLISRGEVGDELLVGISF